MTGSNRNQRGFSLLIAVILSAAAASITISLTTLAYKSLILSSTALESQFAFYAADTALECALYYDNGLQNAFPYTTTYGTVTGYSCAGTAISFVSSYVDIYTVKYVSEDPGSPGSPWFTVNTTGANADCGSITVYKTNGLQPPTYPTGSLYATGVNVPCSNISTDPRAIERGIRAFY